MRSFLIAMRKMGRMIPYIFIAPPIVLGFLSILPLMIWTWLVGGLFDAIWRKVTRRGREEAHKAWLIKREVQKRAEQYRKERLERGLPAKVTYAEWEEHAAKRLVYGPWEDDGQICIYPRREDTPQA